MKRKETHYLLPSIFIIIIIILLLVLHSSINLQHGTLRLWIRNYNSPCTLNNTTDCDLHSYKIIRITINDDHISGPITLKGGEIWKKDIQLNVGKHRLEISTGDSGVEFQKINIQKDQITCIHHPWENSGIDLRNINYYSCPP